MRPLLLTLLLLLAAPAYPAIDAMTWELGGLYEAACEYAEVDCTEIPSPLLIVTDFGRRINALGMYPLGTNVILLTAECTGRLADKTKCDGIVVHELVHYLTYLVYPKITSCQSEALAWDAFNAYVIDVKRYDLTRKDWIKDYPQCAQFQKLSSSSGTPSE